LAYWLDQFHIFLLVLARVSALLTVAPIFGHRMYLGRAKIGLAIMISFVAFPLVAERGLDVPEALIPYVMMVLAEIVMGMVLGFSVLLLFIGIQFAGQLAGLQMGFGIVNVIDPNSSEQISIIGQFLNIMAILIVLTIDGHHLILQGLLHSFDVVPLGGVELKEEIIEKIIVMTNEVFVIAIKISTPILISLFLISVAMGVLARTVPQMNVFMIGFPVQMGVGLAILMVMMPLFYLLLTKSLGDLQRDMMVLIDFFA